MRERKEKNLFKGRWLSLKEATYRSQSGELVSWEVVERTGEESVIILLARLVPSRRYLLLRQFRAGVNRRVIALPAGVVGPGEDIHQQAIKELKEETGYTGKVVEVSPILKLNPAILDCDVNVFRMEIDEEDPANAHPQQELEPEEEIEVILQRREEIKEFLIEEKASGTEIDVACWLILCFAKI
jgi:ADP-ribose pyrophosphatase